MTAPKGPISLAEEYLRSTLADVTAFRTWCGAANQSEALARIHNDGLPAPADLEDGYTKTELQSYAPYAIVETDEEDGYRMQFASVGDGYNYAEGGKLILRLVQIVAAGDKDDIEEAERKWKNSIGQIMAGLFEKAGGAGYLAITGLELAELFRFHPNDQPALGDQQGAMIGVEWGTAGD